MPDEPYPLGHPDDWLPPDQEWRVSAHFWALLQVQYDTEADCWVYDMTPTWACLAEND